MTSDETNAKRLSAELNGLITYYRNHGGFDEWKKDTTWLICTDTYQGQQVAALLAEWGSTHKLNMITQPITDLNTAHMAEFQLGMNKLVEWCENHLAASKQSNHIVFNLVGGFKALQGYMQTLGMFYANEIVYIFETSGELLSIPPLPINLDEGAKQTVRDNLQLVRRLAYINRGTPVSECSALPASMLQIIDDKCWLSPWGMLMFLRFKNELYREKVLAPWIDSIVFTEKAQKTAQSFVPPRFDTQRCVILNERIDELCVYQLSGRETNPSSLHVHSIAGTNPDFPPESKYIFYAWSDGKAWRGYFHFKGDTLIIDDFGPHVKEK